MIRHGARIFASFILLLASIAITLAGLATIVRIGHLLTAQGDLRGWVQVAALLTAVVMAMIFLLGMALLAEQVGGFSPGQLRDEEKARQRRPPEAERGHGGMRTGPPAPPPPGPASPPKPPDHRPVS